MGSRLHGNDGASAPTSVIPAQGDRCTTVIPAQSLPSRRRGRESRDGRGDGFPSPRERRGQRTHLDAGGSYAKVSERGNLCPAWCVIATPKAGRNVGRPNQVGESRELTLPQPVHPE